MKTDTINEYLLKIAAIQNPRRAVQMLKVMKGLGSDLGRTAYDTNAAVREFLQKGPNSPIKWSGNNVIHTNLDIAHEIDAYLTNKGLNPKDMEVRKRVARALAMDSSQEFHPDTILQDPMRRLVNPNNYLQRKAQILHLMNEVQKGNTDPSQVSDVVRRLHPKPTWDDDIIEEVVAPKGDTASVQTAAAETPKTPTTSQNSADIVNKALDAQKRLHDNDIQQLQQEHGKRLNTVKEELEKEKAAHAERLNSFHDDSQRHRDALGALKDENEKLQSSHRDVVEKHKTGFGCTCSGSH